VNPGVVIAVSVVAIVAAVTLFVLIGRVAEEALRLRREAAFFSDLRPALVELRSELRGMSETWRRVGRR
jgi:hypothetical protein